MAKGLLNGCHHLSFVHADVARLRLASAGELPAHAPPPPVLERRRIRGPDCQQPVPAARQGRVSRGRPVARKAVVGPDRPAAAAVRPHLRKGVGGMFVNYLLTGAIAMASCVIALFFLRFWRNSGDRFFLYFA